MKYEDLYSFIMENIPEEEWNDFYKILPQEDVTYAGIYPETYSKIVGQNVYGIVDRETNKIKMFNMCKHGQAWRQDYFDLFYDYTDPFDLKILEPGDELKRSIIDFLLSEYMYSIFQNHIWFGDGKWRVASELFDQIPGERLSYKGNRRNMALTPEYWVYSKYDSDEKLSEIVSGDKRFKTRAEREFAFDVVLSIRDFMKYFPFIGVDRKVA